MDECLTCLTCMYCMICMAHIGTLPSQEGSQVRNSMKLLKVSLTRLKFQAKQLAFAQPSSSKSHQPELDRAGVPPGPPKLLAELDSSARQSPTNGPPPRSLRISLVNPAISLLQLAVACHCEYSFFNTISRYYFTMFHSPHVILQPTNRPFALDDEC